MSKRSKTVNFPRYTLLKCETWIKQINPAKSLDKSELSELQGFKTDVSMSATSARAAMTMFGLLEYESGEYSLTPLGKMIRSPISQYQLECIRIVTFLLPDKFREIYGFVKGKTNIELSIVRSLLAQRNTVTDKVASDFERIFIESGVHSKVVTKNKEKTITIFNIDSALSLIGLDYSLSHEIIFKTLIEKFADIQNCKQFLDLVYQKSVVVDESKVSKASEEQIHSKEKIQSVHTVKLSEEKSIVLFKLDEEIYTVTMDDLKGFIRQRGKETSGNIHDLG